jgi:hypothetical protein
LWWSYEKRHLDHDVLVEIEDIEDSFVVDRNEGKEDVEGRGGEGMWRGLRRRGKRVGMLRRVRVYST